MLMTQDTGEAKVHFAKWRRIFLQDADRRKNRTSLNSLTQFQLRWTS